MGAKRLSDAHPFRLLTCATMWCWQDVLDLVRGQDKDSFTCLLINWYRRAKGKYKVPTFAHQELDLHKVFWEVQDKGGYDQVTNFKLWKVCPFTAPPPLPSSCHVCFGHREA